MSKKKKIIVTIVSLVVAAAIVAGAIVAYLWHQSNSLTAEVQPVENLTWYYGGSEMSSSGMVTNDYNQDVFLLDNQTISEIFVEEGQEVKAGDQLMSYDMTLTNLQVDIQKLEIENIKNKIILAKRELESLRNETPISETPAVPDPIPEPVPEPDPVLPPEKDEATGAYHYISGELDTLLAQVSGDGSMQTPYVILCMPGCYVEGGYLNQLAASADVIFVRLQIIDPNTGAADPNTFWDISSQQFNGMTFDEAAKWSVETRQPILDIPQEEVPDLPQEEPTVPEEPQGYTAAELAAAIRKAENDLKDYDLQRRKAELLLEQMEKLTEDGVVLATVDGTVKTVGDKENPPKDGSAFITVAGSEGLYVTGSLSELLLGQVEVGQVVFANSWESGMSFEATIQEISPYPSENSNSWGEGNPNVSYYPYVAYIADPQGLRNGEYVDLTMTATNSSDSSAIYLQKAYIREEDGKSYVMIADENDRLKKQYVETGKTIYGEAIEIKAGLTREDRIAFPYGKTAKEGVKIKDASGSGAVFY